MANIAENRKKIDSSSRFAGLDNDCIGFDRTTSVGLAH